MINATGAAQMAAEEYNLNTYGTNTVNAAAIDALNVAFNAGANAAAITAAVNTAIAAAVNAAISANEILF